MGLAASTTFAASICPVMTGGNAGGGGGVNPTYIADSGGTNGGCNLLITFNADGSITTSAPNAALSYDNGGDDNMVGILNNTSSPISAVTLSGTSVPFGFDGDGACDPTWTFGGGNPCGTTTSGYGHEGVTFSGISAGGDAGTVDFAGGIADGGSDWFSLEGPVDLSLTIVPVTTTPEPSTLFVMLLGVGLVGIAYRRFVILKKWL
jgi:hypothetical protein